MASSSTPLLLLQILTLTLTLTLPLPAATADENRTYILRMNHLLKPSVFPSHSHWYSSFSLSPPLHIYSTIFHGFSASLPPSLASSLSSHPAVLSLFPDRLRLPHTTRSPQFLGLRTHHGLWSSSDYASDSIIAILDTGISPSRPSFSDTNLPPIPSRWRGSSCQPPSLCNRKLLAARFFSAGRDASSSSNINRTADLPSPFDADGHGTHTASTAAGRHVFGASLSGYASGVAKGVAPKARIAAYKVCWKGSGCLDSDILAGFDAAVADGVDVVSISIGGGDGISSPYYLDPIAVGAFGAVSRGVFVAASAGNDGPTAMSVTNLAPWLTTVGAGTIDRTFPADIVLGDGRRLAGVSLYSGPAIDGEMYPLVYPGGESGGLPASLCMENSLDPGIVKGKIVVCDRGSSPRVAKGLVVKDAGGVGMILANGASNGEGLVGDAHVLPACAVGSDEGDSLKSYITASANPTATLAFRGTVVGVKPAPVVASFSGRGPNGLTPEILKPDLIAPGVNILAAWTDAVGPTGLDSDHRRTEFNILSGTSMACPHVSGAAALLKSAHPSWSPAAIRSAMMTTASLVDNTMRPVTDEGSGEPVTPLDFGAGHLNLDRAMDPGLVYDIGDGDYVAFLCALEYDPKMIQIITHSPASCPAKRPAPENLNYPSITVVFEGAAAVNQSRTVVRTATNVGGPAGIYRAKVEMVRGKGLAVGVKPGKMVFSPAVTKQSFALTVTVTAVTASGDGGAGAAAVDYGYLTWSDGTHEVRSPIVVSRIQPL